MLEVRDRQQWRAWLGKHHDSRPAVWLVFYKEHTGVNSIPYEDSVREALCFGWIDSLVKRLDDDRYARKFTPRQPASKWSAINRKRWMDSRQPACLRRLAWRRHQPPTRTRHGRHFRTCRPTSPKALKANPKAWTFFQELAPSYRRHFVVWIHTARRPETREKRIREFIALLAAGKKLSLKKAM